MPRTRRILALSLGLFSLASLGQAAGWMTGCFLCLPHNFGVDADDKCKMVGHQEYGDGWQCKDEYVLGAHICMLSGGSCYNEDAGGGGEGGSAGNGGEGCVVPLGAGCPAECSSCTQEAYPRLAI